MSSLFSGLYLSPLFNNVINGLSYFMYVFFFFFIYEALTEELLYYLSALFNLSGKVYQTLSTERLLLHVLRVNSDWERLFLILLDLNKRQHLLYLLTDHILWCNCHECQVSQCDKGNCFSKKCKKCLTKLFSFYEILFQHSKKESTKRKSVLSWTYLEFVDMQAVSGHNVALYYGVMYNKSWEKLKPM